MKIWRTPRDFSHTPGGTRTPGWEPLMYINVNDVVVVFAQQLM